MSMGSGSRPAGQYFDGNPDPQLGKFERFEAQPNDPEALRGVLMEEQRSREKLRPGDFKAHVTMLHDNRIEREARRVVEKMKSLQEPNSPDKTHFMVELSPYFVRLATEKDADRLFSMLPYKTLAFSRSKDRFGTYALIDKGEDRSKGSTQAPPLCPGAACRRQRENRPEKGGKDQTERNGGMSMTQFTVEEMNLLSIYHEGSREQLRENMNAALPYMDADMRELAKRTLSKVDALTETEYAELAVYAADEA